MEKKFNIYTKTGDDGTSGLIGGTRVKKYDLRLEAYGTVDELNSWIGVLLSGLSEENIVKTLTSIQNNLFVIGSHLATDESRSDLKKHLPCCTDDIQKLETEIDRMQEELPPLKHFVLPGGSIYSGYAHVTRTVCRRAERRVVELSESIPVEKNILIFLNRLSDYLFVLSRYINHLGGISDIFWETEKS
ncbi:MAG TPA: cob(I)yrinic acid a,c-diamide adenosyltransferase [Prolixibacteraceae bacterium]|nr:cob(I)yrinic acid a,c-diamide adenosyltransferase [Prolixibacteraceae bacterium]